VRLRRVVARAALIAALASVVVPGLAGSRIPGAPTAIDPATFQEVRLARSETSMTMPTLDLDLASEGRLHAASILSEPRLAAGPALERPVVSLPSNAPTVKILWHLDNNISWYGPGFYGNGGACGMIPGGLQPETVGVAHRTLPCGTRVELTGPAGITLVVPVIDRGPYVAGRSLDLSSATRAALACSDLCRVHMTVLP